MKHSRTSAHPRARRVVIVAAVLVALVLAADAVLVLSGALDSDPPVVAAPASTTLAPTTTTTAPKPLVPVTTALATPTGTIPTFDAPDGNQVGTAGTWYGYPMTMPIVEQRAGWLRIMLPERPNGSTAWVRAADATVSSTPYRVVVDLTRTMLTVYQSGFPLFSAWVGIGKDATPTAPGHFFVAVVEIPGPAGYGPVVLDTSGHSEAIQSWEGSGDAITAIHGSFGADDLIGNTGAKVSNGCIRMHAEDQQKLDVVPVGSPVDIIP